MTYSPCAMPSQVRCARVPPTHGGGGAPPALEPWASAVDMRPQDDDLPLDPRTWQRADVAAWVSRCGGKPERFPMNGKALCLMTQDMFTARVPGQGHKLHSDFRRRLAKALALQELLEKMANSYKY